MHINELLLLGGERSEREIDELAGERSERKEELAAEAHEPPSS
jgi:hypothetical protein